MSKTKDSVRTVETDQATIRFTGGVVDDDSSSEEEEFCDTRSHLSSLSDGKLKTANQPEQASSDIEIARRRTSRSPDPKAATEENNTTSDTRSASNSIVHGSTKGHANSADDPIILGATSIPSHRCDPAHLNESRQNNKRVENVKPIAADRHDSYTTGVNSEVSAGCSGYDVKPTDNSTVKSNTEDHDQSQSENVTKPQARFEKPPTRPQRFNPFNRSDLGEQDTFPQLTEAQLRGPNMTNSKAKSYDSDEFSDDLDNEDFACQNRSDLKEIDAELGITDDYFAQPEGHFGLTTVEELDLAIQNCKQLVLQTPPGSDRMKNLVRKLVQLRLKRSEALETTEVEQDDFKIVVGHRFEEKESNTSKRYCEKCNSVIWGVLQSWYKCAVCGFCCHAKCLNLITRTCASVKVNENPNYTMAICPEKGLAAQNYRCAECRSSISYQNGYSEPRQCDYTGNFYCELCHWNDVMISPARVLHNWDFEPRKVCRASKQFLKLIMTRAVIRVQDVNPMLFGFVEELNDVKRLREEILVMKRYFLSCKAALETKLLLQLKERQHFVENSDMYSLQDLEDAATDVLLPEMAKIHSSFAQHIKTDCQLCQVKGYICELCDDKEILFPFDNIATVCSQCTTVLHRHCFIKRNQRCPKCERISQRYNELDGGPSFEDSLQV